MSLALVRIDSRLIHGQIIEAWAPYLNLDCILVADDEVATDAMQKTIMRMAVPRKIALGVGAVRQIVDEVRAGKWDNVTGLLLFADVDSGFRAYEYGLPASVLNIGNVHHAPGSRQVAPSVALNERDLAQLHKLQKIGIRIEFRSVPRQKPISLTEIELSKAP